MKTYKWFRWLLNASALTTVMFVMQACYGSPNRMDMPDYPDEMEMTDENEALEVLEATVTDTIVAE